jgi:hypothetical protein
MILATESVRLDASDPGISQGPIFCRWVPGGRRSSYNLPQQLVVLQSLALFHNDLKRQNLLYTISLIMPPSTCTKATCVAKYTNL